MKARLFLLLLIAPLNVFAAVTPWLEFSQINGHVYLPVEVNGIKTQVLLDSGSQLNCINTAFIEAHDLDLSKGRKILVSGVHDTEERSTYNNVNVNLFGSDFELDNVVEINFAGEEKGLLLGASFFDPFIVQINYPENKMRLLSRDSIDMNSASNVKSMDSKGSGMPIAQVTINDNTFWFLVDTGSNHSVFMERRFASKAGLLESIEGSSETRGVNSSGKQDIAMAKTIKFGPYEIADVRVSFPAPGETTNLESQHSETGTRIKGKKIAGIIGSGIFQYFLLTIDYKTGKVHAYLPQE